MGTAPKLSIDGMYNLAIEAYKHCKQKRDDYTIDDVYRFDNGMVPQIHLPGGTWLIKYDTGWSVEGTYSDLSRRMLWYIMKLSKEWIDNELWYIMNL